MMSDTNISRAMQLHRDINRTKEELRSIWKEKREICKKQKELTTRKTELDERKEKLEPNLYDLLDDYFNSIK